MRYNFRDDKQAEVKFSKIPGNVLGVTRGRIAARGKKHPLLGPRDKYRLWKGCEDIHALKFFIVCFARACMNNPRYSTSLEKIRPWESKRNPRFCGASFELINIICINWHTCKEIGLKGSEVGAFSRERRGKIFEKVSGYARFNGLLEADGKRLKRTRDFWLMRSG